MNTPHNLRGIPEFGANQGRHTEARVVLGTLAAALVAVVAAYQIAPMPAVLVLLVILVAAGIWIAVPPRSRGR